MFAVASLLALLGLWAFFAALFDWDSCLGVIDMRAAGEVLGDDTARWAFGAGGVVLLLVALLCVF